MTEWTVANDCHIGSKYNDDPTLKVRLLALSDDGRTVLAGDIADLACCKKSDVYWIRLYLDTLRYRFGKKFVDGNHERNGIGNRFYIEDGIYFTHGDLESDYDKWSKYRFKPHGAAWYKLPIIAFLDGLDFLKANRPLAKGFLQRAADMAKKHNCHTYVCGHVHPDGPREHKIDGVRIVILPPGINKVWL